MNEGSNSATFIIEAAERIRLRLQRSGEDVVAIGHDLIAVRDMLGAERFQEWIVEEFEMSRSAAYRFISVAERIPNPKLGLSASALYELAAPSTPDSVVQEVVERAERGEPTSFTEVRRLRQEVREVEQETEEPAPKHRVTNGKARPSESHSSHDAEVTALLQAWDAARPSAKRDFLSISGLMHIPTQETAADLSDEPEHQHVECVDRATDAGDEDTVAGLHAAGGERSGQAHHNGGSSPREKARTAGKGHAANGGVDLDQPSFLIRSGP